jgi:repressor LexA
MLNNNQKKLLEVIRGAIGSEENLSMQDMAEMIGVNSPNTVLYHLRKLEEKGFIRRDVSGKVARVNSPDDSTSALAYLPVLGNARCGAPLDQIIDEATTRMVPVPLRLLNKSLKADLYLIQAIGDSMSPKIEEGDYVIFEAKQTPQNGDIVVARTEEGFTIKVFKEIKDQFILEPTNSNYSPLIFDKPKANRTFNIDGIAVGVFKPQENLEGDK